MQATWGIGTTLKVPTDLTDLLAVANDGAAIRQRLLHEALAKDRCNHGHYHKNGLVHWSSHSQSTHQMLRYYLSALEMQRPFNDPLRRFHRSERERPNTLLSQSLHFSETANWKRKYDGLSPTEMRRLKQLEDENAKLRKVVADLSPDKEMLQGVLRRRL
jgi:hypothetical protein